MAKSILLVVMLFFMSSAYSQQEDGCPVGSKEKLVCEVIMCNPLGFAQEESRKECEQVNRKYAIYLAKLGPFKKPAKCYKRNDSCQKVGIMTNALVNPDYCDALISSAEQDACNSAIGASNDKNKEEDQD